MNRHRILSFAALIAAAISAAVLSCAPSPVRQGKGSIVIRFGGSSSAVRALSGGLPNGTLPTFSSVKVRVSGSDMADVETTVTSPNAGISLEVPAGSDRLVELTAVPDWTATTAAFPNAALPAFAMAYGGSAKVDVPAGGSASVSVTLTLTLTRILLPDPSNGDTLNIASELSSSAGMESHPLLEPMLGVTSDFEFDNRGFLYISGAAEINRFSRVNGNLISEEVSDWLSGDLAYDAPRHRLYDFFEIDGAGLLYFDVTEEVMTQYEVLCPEGYEDFYSGSIAVDKDGFLYVPVWKWDDVEVAGYYIAKIAVTAPTDVVSDSSIVAVASFASLGLMVAEDVLNVRDMAVVDGKLYIAAGLNYFDDYHMGKVVEARLSDLGKEREFGFANANYPSNPNQQFYGPMRFIAVAPRRLVIADEGLREVENTDIDRVVELNLDTGSFDGIWFVDQTDFFADYGGS